MLSMKRQIFGFHSLVALSHLGETPQSVIDELARRFDLSGLEEKASTN